MDYAAVEAALLTVGLCARGGFHPRAGEGVPPLPDGRPAGTLVLAGSIGDSLWPAFAASAEFADGESDPLDRWSRRVLEAVSGRLGAAALFPFGGPPHHPFQRWARRAEPVAPSPLGLLIHPEFGLWHAYRGALLFAERFVLPPHEVGPRPCDSCRERPCLSACPVGAFDGFGYDVGACTERLRAAPLPCFETACLARAACPVGRDKAYGRAQSHFLMRAFLAAR